VVAGRSLRVIRSRCGAAKPDHATLARFVERDQDALADVFGSVLGL
jgi:hypothetical protein